MMASLQAEMKSLFGFSLTWLYAFEDNAKKTSQLICVVGEKKAEVELRYPSIDISHDRMMENIFNSDFPVYVEDARMDPTTDKKIVNALDYRTVINCQLCLHGESIGLIGTGTLEAEGVRIMSLDEIAYFSAVANIVSITLDRISYREKSLLDPLTKINNKRGLEVHAETLLALAIRHSQSVGIIYIDLDNFKSINDQFGHESGDMALISFSENLKNTLRRSDVIARVGGDEFVLLLVDVNNEDYIHKIIEQIDNQCSILKVDKHNFSLQFSAGYAIFPQDGPDLNELISLADKNMYQIKSISRHMTT
ncbi:GGDEF domain-containing protein [Colwellia sp. Arc7-635]|uniref:GGDEF domain-containing protein n=1 Tax=Colwellia sp. Arc7-635 TaxID=2497879 RepID=UPI000F85B0DA|nr:GGDEF domain-containing protein [Colwellia sp. Arc7-635]AZQ84540.1 GGDEF domain-containing protein [Colwellia sp. Arc7-635]